MDTHALDETRLRRLLAVGRSFMQELDPEALLDEILDAAQELTGARYVALGILGRERRGLAHFLTRGVDDAAHQAIGEHPQGRGIFGALMEGSLPLRLDDLHAHPRSFGFPPQHPPMTSFLGVPIVVRGEVWGNLYLADKQDGTFDEADQEALVVLADWAAVAVENARLYAELQGRHDDATRANHVLAATTTIVRAIGAETDLEPVLKLIVKRGRALVNARTMLVALPKGADLEVVAIAGERDDVRPGVRFPIADSAAGEVLLEGRPRRLPVNALGVSFAPLGVDARGGSWLVPLVFRGRSLGVLMALDPLDGSPAFRPEDEELLFAFAASAATAVVTAQSIDEGRLRDVLASAEQERRRWARELHDETIQGLAGLHVRLAIAEQRSPDADTAAAVHDVREAMGTEITKLRSLITELRPAALDELGLTPALDSLARGVAASTGLQIETHVNLQDQRMDPELETTVFRLVQESLTNVVKHAEATACTITVIRAEGHVEVTVSDDGRGLDEVAVAQRKGFGLTGMRERAHLAGGVLDLRTGPDGGTELHARLPVVSVPGGAGPGS